MQKDTTMTNMKRISRGVAAGAALAVGLLVQSPAHAQFQGQQQGGGQRWEQGQGRRQNPGQRLDRQVAMLTQRLQLSQGQAQQIRGILQQQDEQFRAWFQQNGAQRGQRNGQQGRGGWQGQRGDNGQGGWQGQRGDNGQGGWQGRRGENGQRGEQGQRERRQLPPELQAIRDRADQQIDRVLNDRQRAEYQQLRQQRAEGRREGRGQRDGGQQGGWGNGNGR
jgi:hypothetical protein